jgi:hypothetical protein
VVEVIDVDVQRPEPAIVIGGDRDRPDALHPVDVALHHLSRHLPAADKALRFSFTLAANAANGRLTVARLRPLEGSQ